MFIIGPSQKNPVYLLIYVDDLVIVGDRSGTDTIKSELVRYLLHKIWEVVRIFLASKFNDFGPDFFSQKPFTEKVIHLAGQSLAKPASSPLPLSHPLYAERTALEERKNKKWNRCRTEKLWDS